MRPPRTGRRWIRLLEVRRRGGRAGAGGAGGFDGVAARCNGSRYRHDRPQVPFAEHQHPVGDLCPGGKHEPFCISVRARAARRDLHGLDAGIGQDGLKGRGELSGPVPDQEPEAGGAVTQVHQEVADLLDSPGPVRVRGDTEDMHITAAYLHDEQAVQALQGQRAIHVEKVRGEHRGCLGVQERPPCCVGLPLRCWGNLQRLEDPADRGRADPVAELEQLALDPLVSPAVVLGGEPLDRRGDLGADRRPSCPVRVGPLAGDQAAVPPQDGAGGDQPVHPKPWRQEPDQRGEDGAVGPVVPQPGVDAAQHGDFVPQHEPFGVLGGR